MTKCWLAPAELTRLEHVAGSADWTREIAMQLMGRCGLRASEVSYPADQHLRWSEDGACWLFEIRGKNTRGGEPKVRDAWMPEPVAEDVHKYTRERGLAETDPWVSASTSTIRRWVREAREQLVAETDDWRWEHVSSHDLRRSWATYHLVERQVDVRTMMAVGGWSDYAAIEPYLAAPTEARIGEAMCA